MGFLAPNEIWKGWGGTGVRWFQLGELTFMADSSQILRVEGGLWSIQVNAFGCLSFICKDQRGKSQIKEVVGSAGYQLQGSFRPWFLLIQQVNFCLGESEGSPDRNWKTSDPFGTFWEFCQVFSGRHCRDRDLYLGTLGDRITWFHSSQVG